MADNDARVLVQESGMARVSRSILAAAAAVLTGALAASALAQAPESPGPGTGVTDPDTGAEADLTFPPTASDAPGAATLEPQDEERDPTLEIVVVKGRADWRLPDLGSSLREQREAEAKDGQRIQVDALPLYHKLQQDPDAEIFDEDPDLRGVRVGFLQLFRIGVGRGDRIPDRDD